MDMRPTSQRTTNVTSFDDGQVRQRRDQVVTEEPLEVRVVAAGESRTVAITMRTPGADFELGAGFLFAEGVVTAKEQITGISYCQDSDLPKEQLYNIVIVELGSGARPDLDSLERHFHVSSACGVCGKASLEAIALRGVKAVPDGPTISPDIITSFPDKLRDAQRLFATTGGIHAAGLFTPDGALVEVREDVGRHNAVDKVVGWALLDGRLPLGDHILMVSGRSSFEIAQKALAAGVPVVCSVSAPSTLAIDVANEFGLTLVGFVRDGRFNVYAGPERIQT